LDRNEKDFRRISRPYLRDPRFRKLRSYIQHGNTSTYEHSLNVARTAFGLNRRLRLRADEESLVRAALLHDYYLYDWHTFGDKLHGYHHPSIAAQNAERDFGISGKERKIIESHMWPLTLTKLPASREAWLLTAADKYCSIREILGRRS
jgi:uncharacterized protein